MRQPRPKATWASIIRTTIVVLGAAAALQFMGCSMGLMIVLLVLSSLATVFWMVRAYRSEQHLLAPPAPIGRLTGRSNF